MSHLLRSTMCTGTPGSCTIQLGRGRITPSHTEHTTTDLQMLETRLYAIYSELRDLTPNDGKRLRELQVDAETTAEVYRVVTRGKITVGVSHVLGRIGELLKQASGKIGHFFTGLSKREVIVEKITDISDTITDEAEKQRVLHSVYFRKSLPRL